MIDNLDNDEVEKVEKTLEKQINELQATITKIQAPNMRAMQVWPLTQFFSVFFL